LISFQTCQFIIFIIITVILYQPLIVSFPAEMCSGFCQLIKRKINRCILHTYDVTSYYSVWLPVSHVMSYMTLIKRCVGKYKYMLTGRSLHIHLPRSDDASRSSLLKHGFTAPAEAMAVKARPN